MLLYLHKPCSSFLHPLSRSNQTPWLASTIGASAVEEVPKENLPVSQRLHHMRLDRHPLLMEMDLSNLFIGLSRMTTFVHFLLGPASPPMLHPTPPPCRTHHRTPLILIMETTPGVSSGSGGQPRTIIPRQLGKMASLRSALGSLKPPFTLPKKRPALLEHGWPNPMPWWWVRWIPGTPSL